MINNGLVTWLPTLYRQVFHLPLQTSLAYGWITSGAGVGLAIACALDRQGRAQDLVRATAFLVATAPLILLTWLGAKSRAGVGAGVGRLCRIADHRVLALSLLGGALSDASACGRHRLRQRVAAGRIGHRLPILVGTVVGNLGVPYVFPASRGSIALTGGLVMLTFGIETKGRCWRSCRPEYAGRCRVRGAGKRSYFSRRTGIHGGGHGRSGESSGKTAFWSAARRAGVARGRTFCSAGS